MSDFDRKHKKSSKKPLIVDDRDIFLEFLDIDRESIASKDSDDHELFLEALKHIPQKNSKEEDNVYNKTIKRRKHRRIYTSIDLHGKFVEDAIEILLIFIKEQQQKGIRLILVIHGKGSGAIKRAVLSLLDTHPLVLDYKEAPIKLGGSGALLVRLKEHI